MKTRGLFVVLAVVLFASACLGGEGDIFALEVGDCFDDEEAALSGEYTELNSVPIVDCSEPHDNEVFALFEVPDGDFPGRDGMLSIGRQGCVDRFEAFVGIDYFDSELDVYPLTPTDGSWSNGDREVVCALYDISLAKMTGTQRDASR